MRFYVRLLVAIAVFCLPFWYFGPYEPAPLEVRFDDSVIGPEIDAYFAQREARFDDITHGAEKRVIWAGRPGEVSEWAVLYVHGFSATSEEIRPIPDRVALALGANLVFTRLTGHGRSGDAMAEATVADWMRDTAEALAVARRAGRRVLVISTSTGGTLMAAAAQDPALMRQVAGMIFVSPNFGVNSPAAQLLNWPAARYWAPLVAGARRTWEPLNEGHARFWTTDYPTVAALPMAALVQAVDALDHARATVPALFYFAREDKVVRSDLTLAVAEAWGGPVQVAHPELGPEDDPFRHVIAGDILSPGQTEASVARMLDWIGTLD